MTRASSLLSKKRKSVSTAAAPKEKAEAKSEVVLDRGASSKTATSTRAPPPPKKKQRSSPVAPAKAIKEEAVAASAPPSSTPTKKKKQVSSLPPSPNASRPALVTKADRIFAQLAELYPDPPCPLNHANRTQLLVAVMLSAQTTDVKVNECTRTLFDVAPTASALAELGANGIEPHIRSLGLAPTKARNVAATARILVERYGGNGDGAKDPFDLPLTVTREELESLPGVGRKTASVVLSMSGVASALPVDTHIDRLSKRWGFSRPGASVLQVESDLCEAFRRHESQFHKLHLRLIYFGREHCPAKSHERKSCPICEWAAV